MRVRVCVLEYYAVLNCQERGPSVTQSLFLLQDMARLLLPVTEPRTRIDAATWGTMGVGLGSAIAAATVHHGERAVVAVEGDSAFGFSGMELETMVRCAASDGSTQARFPSGVEGFLMPKHLDLPPFRMTKVYSPPLHDGSYDRCGRYKLPVVVVVMNNGGIYGGDRRTRALSDAAVKGAAKGGFGSDPAPTAFVEGSRCGITYLSGLPIDIAPQES